MDIINPGHDPAHSDAEAEQHARTELELCRRVMTRLQSDTQLAAGIRVYDDYTDQEQGLIREGLRRVQADRHENLAALLQRERQIEQSLMLLQANGNGGRADG